MPKKNKLSRFVSELQRRNVYKVLAMYAASAFIVLQLVDILTPALSLPPWILTIVVILLAIGFPVTAILSWIFDITPKGIEKTESFNEDEIEDESAVLKRRKFKVTDGIIIVLVAIVCILAYPKIFNKDEFSSLRDSDGKISIAVFPFDNSTGDSTFNVWSGGFQYSLISTLSNSNELSVLQYQAVNNLVDIKKELYSASVVPSLEKDVAKILETKTYIHGDILKSGNNIRINARLIDANTEEIYKTYQVDGTSEDDFISMADSLAHLIKNYIEIKKIKDQRNDLELKGTSLTNSSEAFKFYIKGFDAFMNLDMETASEWFLRSIDSDSTFISPYILLSYTYRQLGRNNNSRKWFEKAWDKKEIVPLEQELLLRQLNAFYNETPHEEIKYVKLLTEMDELNTMYWLGLGLAHSRLYEYNEALKSWEKAIEITKKWDSYYKNPYIYFLMGNAYHKINEHEKEEKILEEGIKHFPENFMILQTQAICAYSKGNIAKGDKIVDEYKAMRKRTLVCTDAMIATGIGGIYKESKMYDKAEDFYRESLALEPKSLQRLNNLAWFLIDSETNVDEGVELVSKALNALPDNSILLDTNGWGLYKQGKHQEALKLVRQAWENRSSYYHPIKLHLEELEKVVNGET